MNVITDLFTQYSIETQILFILALGAAIKFTGDLWDYFYNKVRKHFNYENKKDQEHKEIIEGIHAIETKAISLQEKLDNLDIRTQNLESKTGLTTERLQENSRSYIIDKHHYFCYKVHAIDDLSLQSLERRYLYYKAAKGNTFIDGLMEEIRELPRITSYSSGPYERGDNIQYESRTT